MHKNLRRLQFQLLFVMGLLIGIDFFAQSSCFALMAGTGQRLITNQNKNSTYALGISTTLLNGEGKEYVYAPELDGMKISDLRWESDNVFLLSGHLTMQYKNWLTLNTGWWEKLSANTGTMTDDAWNVVEGLQDSSSPRFQTNFSESKSDLTEGSAYDIHGRLNVMKFQQNHLHVGAIIGYKKEEWEWEASDGYWISIEELVETNPISIVGTGTAGEFEGVSIRYKQETTIPYIGISIDFTGQHVNLEAHALYSDRVEMKATDDHLEQNLRTVDSLEDGEYWSVGLNHTWKMSPKLSLVAVVEYEEIRTIKGEAKWTFYDDDIEKVVDNGAGAGYHTTAVTFSMVYVF